MKRTIMLSAAVCLLSMMGCNKNPSDSNSEFSNKLTLGTGMNGFNLVNEGTTFTRTGANAMIYFRLESAADMAGSNVTIKVEKNSSGTWSNYLSFPFTSIQSYGHIFLSGFSLSDAGSFRATGILATGSVTIASKDFTVQ
jgi:hypothetical protein